MSKIDDGNKLEIRLLDASEKQLLQQVVTIHLETFQGFFLTFMGRGFLTQMYRSYCKHNDSGLYVAFQNERPIGFLAFSANLSGLYKYMIKTRLFPFAWYSIGAFFRKPKIFMRLLRAFLKPSESKRAEKYVELASIGVAPEAKEQGIGSELISRLVEDTDFDRYAYITLETDAEDNEIANRFYFKNGFSLARTYFTAEGRKMNEYRKQSSTI